MQPEISNVGRYCNIKGLEVLRATPEYVVIGEIPKTFYIVAIRNDKYVVITRGGSNFEWEVEANLIEL